jgi:hypothetical protein
LSAAIFCCCCTLEKKRFVGEMEQQQLVTSSGGSVWELHNNKHDAVLDDLVEAKQQQQQQRGPARGGALKSLPLAATRGGRSSSRNNKRFLGVRQRPSGRWVAEIKDTTQKIRLWLGTFDCAEDAARAYDEAAWMLRGSNTRTNFMPAASAAAASGSGGNTFSLSPSSKSARLLLHHHHHRSSKLESSAVAAADDDAAAEVAAISSTPQDVSKTDNHPSETEDSFACCCTPALDVLPTANEFEIPVTSEAAEHYSIPSSGEFDFAAPPTPAAETSVCMVVSNQELHEDVEVVDRQREYNSTSSSSNGSSSSDMIPDSNCSYSSTEESLTLFPEMDHKEWLKGFAVTEQQYHEVGMMSDDDSRCCSYSSSPPTAQSLMNFPEIGDRKWLEPIRRERQYLETQPPLQDADDDGTSAGYIAVEDGSEELHYYTTSFDFSATDLEPLEKVPDTTSSLEEPALSDDTVLLNQHFLKMKVQCSTPLSLCDPNVFQQECLLLSSSSPAEDQGGESSSQDQVIWNSWDLAPICLVS